LATTRPLKLIGIHSYKGGVGKTTVSMLLGLALAGAPLNRRVCLVDLDLMAPGLHCLFGVQSKEPYLLDALIADPARPTAAVNPESLCQTIMAVPGGHLSLIGASPQLEYAARVQSYVLADARAGLLSARLERVLIKVRDAHDIDIFVLDTPPSLFGISRTVQHLIDKHRGEQVHVAMPIRQDLFGCRAMLEAARKEHDARDPDAPAPSAVGFVLNRYDGPGSAVRLHEEFAERILRVDGRAASAVERALLEEWLRPLKLAYLTDSETIRKTAAADGHCPATPAICKEVPPVFGDFTAVLAATLDKEATP